jgi:hypothetical protein
MNETKLIHCEACVNFEVFAPGKINYDFDMISWSEDEKPSGQGVNDDITQ